MNVSFLTPLLADQAAALQKKDVWAKVIVGWQGAGLVVGATLIIILLALCVARFISSRQRKISNSPEKLFKDLCAAHKLSYRERQLLGRLAQQFHLNQPASLFVEPSWWEAERLGSAWTKAMPELDRLRKRLFALR